MFILRLGEVFQKAMLFMAAGKTLEGREKFRSSDIEAFSDHSESSSTVGVFFGDTEICFVDATNEDFCY